MQQRMPLQNSFFFVSHPHFCNDICWLQVHGEPLFLICVCICIQQSPFTACTKQHSLIHCCCRTSKVLPLLHAREYYSTKYMQQAYSLHKTTSTFTSHAPVSASLQIPIHQDIFGYRTYCIYR